MFSFLKSASTQDVTKYHPQDLWVTDIKYLTNWFLCLIVLALSITEKHIRNMVRFSLSWWMATGH